MAGINAEAEQREQLIAETEQRITDLKQQIEKVRDIDARMRKLRERRSSGRTSTDDRTDAGRTGSERPDDYGTEQAAKQIADLEREIEQRKQSREYRSIRTRLRQTEERLTSETDSRKRADAEAVAWKFKYEKAEQEKTLCTDTPKDGRGSC